MPSVNHWRVLLAWIGAFATFSTVPMAATCASGLRCDRSRASQPARFDFATRYLPKNELPGAANAFARSGVFVAFGGSFFGDCDGFAA